MLLGPGETGGRYHCVAPSRLVTPSLPSLLTIADIQTLMRDRMVVCDGRHAACCVRVWRMCGECPRTSRRRFTPPARKHIRPCAAGCTRDGPLTFLLCNCAPPCTGCAQAACGRRRRRWARALRDGPLRQAAAEHQPAVQPGREVARHGRVGGQGTAEACSGAARARPLPALRVQLAGSAWAGARTAATCAAAGVGRRAHAEDLGARICGWCTPVRWGRLLWCWEGCAFCQCSSDCRPCATATATDATPP
eukprot:372601-Prymnesium_polylepis.1